MARFKEPTFVFGGDDVGYVHITIAELLMGLAVNFLLSLKDISRKVLTNTIAFNYGNFWLDCFPGYWSRDFDLTFEDREIKNKNKLKNHLESAKNIYIHRGGRNKNGKFYFIP